MFNSKWLLLVCLCSLLLLSGCGGGGGTSAVVDVQENHRTGSVGLSLDFMKNIPPEEIFENSFTTVGVDMHNKGAYDIVGGVIVLNYDEDYISFDGSNARRFDLEGRNPLNEDGEQRPIFFEGSAGNLDAESQRRDIPLSATACYKYQTILSENVCLSLPYETSKEEGLVTCKSKPTLSFSGQGAPIKISSIDVSVFSSELTQTTKAAFDITVTSSGRGIITSENQFDSLCSSNFGSTKMAEVTIVSASLSDTIMACNQQAFSLKDGKARFRCTMEDIPSYLLPYEAPLYLEFGYGYVETVGTSVTLVAS